MTPTEQVEPVVASKRADEQEISPSELSRARIFIGLQLFFLVVSAFAGGFNFKLWSMLDTALLIQSLGVTGLLVVLEERQQRRLAFRVAILLYLLAILDMGVNVLISGVTGWRM